MQKYSLRSPCSVRTNVIATNDVSVPSHTTIVFIMPLLFIFAFQVTVYALEDEVNPCVLQVTRPCVWWRSAVGMM